MIPWELVLLFGAMCLVTGAFGGMLLVVSKLSDEIERLNEELQQPLSGEKPSEKRKATP